MLLAIGANSQAAYGNTTAIGAGAVAMMDAQNSSSASVTIGAKKKEGETGTAYFLPGFDNLPSCWKTAASY
jgi:hypothetical protein